MPVFDFAQNVLDIVGYGSVPEIQIGDRDNVSTHRVREIGWNPA